MKIRRYKNKEIENAFDGILLIIHIFNLFSILILTEFERIVIVSIMSIMLPSLRQTIKSVARVGLDTKQTRGQVTSATTSRQGVDIVRQ